MRRKTPEDYHKLAESRGIKWHGPVVSNARTRTTWGCEHSHRWEAVYDAIRRGTGCPYCAGLAPKVSEDYYSLAKQNHIEWIGKQCPINSKINTTWRCINEHDWEAPYGNVRSGHGCPYCAGKVRKTADDYHGLAKKHDFKWVGLEISSVHSKTKWECASGHQWKASFASIKRGRGCPQCIDMVNGQPVSQPQRQVHEMLNGILNYPYGPYKIDVALPKKMIAVEYDSYYWHGHRQDYDAKRDAFLLTNGWRVLRIKAGRDVPSKQQLDEAIVKLENGKKWVEIVLHDWGRRKTFAGVRA